MPLIVVIQFWEWLLVMGARAAAIRTARLAPLKVPKGPMHRGAKCLLFPVDRPQSALRFRQSYPQLTSEDMDNDACRLLQSPCTLRICLFLKPRAVSWATAPFERKHPAIEALQDQEQATSPVGAFLSLGSQDQLWLLLLVRIGIVSDCKS